MGETVDPDSGVNPLWHMTWRVAAEAAKMDGNYPGGDNDMFAPEPFSIFEREDTDDRF